MKIRVKFQIAFALNIVLIITGCRTRSIGSEVIFESVKIGNQLWMKNNLSIDHYQNGEPIPEVTDSAKWASLKTGAWCYYYNDTDNGKKFGKLYNWYAVNDPRGLAPTGWHIPSFFEFSILVNTVDGNGNSLKAIGQGFGQGAGTNATGFSAFIVGYRYYDGQFGNSGYPTGFWSSTEYNDDAQLIYLSSYGYIGHSHDNKKYGFNVRCLKN